MIVPIITSESRWTNYKRAPASLTLSFRRQWFFFGCFFIASPISCCGRNVSPSMEPRSSWWNVAETWRTEWSSGHINNNRSYRSGTVYFIRLGTGRSVKDSGNDCGWHNRGFLIYNVLIIHNFERALLGSVGQSVGTEHVFEPCSA